MAIKTTIQSKLYKQQKSTKNIKIITNNNKTKSQFDFFVKLKFLTFSIIIFSISILEAFPSNGKGGGGKKIEIKPLKQKDLICNVGDEHECICNRSMGNLDSSNTPNCNEFIGGNSLDAVKIVLRDFNLTALLYTNETYEQYLRRRISQVLSRYCETVPDECPGTLAELRSQRKKQKQEPNSRELDNLNGK
uniref:Saposin B-type domain-containing protein n=1 Tax=Meloidogyne hapla TaxID=6305 RepID=A0A1I8B1X1_MELHA